jgi:carboxyl-terminal processing protease
VDLVYEIRPGVGYVHLTQFTETSAREVNDAVDSFSDLKGLVLDLRGNPGGLLSQAVDICDHLLTKGQEIVSQRGRGNQSQEYRATRGNGGKTFPIVVLVDRNTASAAEIVSGALQDHDRALIVGETTFGKGLVQTVFDLQNHSMALALTTYHYYTPSGRLIQRDYSGVSLYDYYYNRAGAMPSNSTNREVKLTDDGRTVYGGGGITPDEKIEIPKSTKLEDEIYIKSAYMHYAPRYVAFKTVDKNFVVDDAMLKDFKEYLKSEIFTIQFGQKTGLRVLRDWDPTLQKALNYLPEAEALEQNAHKVQLQKAQARNEAP